MLEIENYLIDLIMELEASHFFYLTPATSLAFINKLIELNGVTFHLFVLC